MAEVIDVNAGLPLPATLNVTFQVQDPAIVAAPAPPVPPSSEDYQFVEARHPNTVLQGLNSLRLNNAFCDVTLCCGGQEFPCHRIVLASFSSYFQVNLSELCQGQAQGVQAHVYQLENRGNYYEPCILSSPLRQCFPLT